MILLLSFFSSFCLVVCCIRYDIAHEFGVLGIVVNLFGQLGSRSCKCLELDPNVQLLLSPALFLNLRLPRSIFCHHHSFLQLPILTLQKAYLIGHAQHLFL